MLRMPARWKRSVATVLAFPHQAAARTWFMVKLERLRYSQGDRLFAALWVVRMKFLRHSSRRESLPAGHARVRQADAAEEGVDSKTANLLSGAASDK